MDDRIAPMTTSLQATATVDRCAHRAISLLQPLADIDLGEFVFFKLVNDYFSNEIQEFGLEL
ncbi:Type IV secretion system protein virB6, partial [Xanthomonas nasturtii]|nr:Type IV secretion system protein virB6 [Xanthomonas nasturtii]